MPETAYMTGSDGRLEMRTPRLRLVAFDAELARLQGADRPAFFAALGAKVEPAWPPDLGEAELLAWGAERVEAVPSERGWHGWVFLMPWPQEGLDRAVGLGGFFGPPDAEGAVEIGYSMLPSFREQGLATEAVRALADWACQDDAVSVIRAETLAHLFASRRVLEKSGFAASGERTRDDGAVLAAYARDCTA